MQRAVRRTGRVPVRRPAVKRPGGRGVSRRAPGRVPAGRPAQQRALRPFDGRTAVFVAGSPTLHRFIATRLSGRADIWVAKPLSSRDHAKGTVFRMKPDVTIVDLDPIWNPAGLPLARAVSEACTTAHVILIVPEGLERAQTISAESESSGWSAVVRRKGDNGERLIEAIAAGINGENWIDPGLTGSDWRQAEGSGGPEEGGERQWEEGVADGAVDRASALGSLSEGNVADAEADGWQKRARQGMR